MKFRLSLMMFFQFFIWGGFFVTMGIYLLEVFQGESGLNTIIGQAYATHNWAAFLAPVIVGLIADRYFNAERVMAVCHILGAGLLWYAAGITDSGVFIWVMLAYFMLYMPTLALVNAVSFANIENPDKEFPAIRVWGTIGWIIAGFVVAQTALGWISIPFLSLITGVENAQVTNIPLLMSALISLIYGIYSFTLPATPPSERGKKFSFKEAFGLDALKLLTNKNFAVFSICCLAISIPLAFYYARANDFLSAVAFGEQSASFMAIGQMSEALFMVLIPFFLIRFGVKWMLLAGMVAWVVRYLLFGMFPESVSLIILGVALHGICYDFFFVTGQLYVDKKAPKNIRASAQGFFNLLTYGAGMLIGNYLLGWWGDAISLEGSTQAGWLAGAASFWILPGVIALAVAIMFIIMFRDDGTEVADVSTATGSEDGEIRPSSIS
ncbi:MAG: MFS transporter [Balneolales bacterium]